MLHILLWTFLFVSPLYIAERYGGGENTMRWLFSKNVVIYGILFYLNYLVLAPRFFFNGKLLIYVFSVLLMVVAFFFISIYAHEMIMGSIEPVQDDINTLDSEPDSGPSYFLLHIYNHLLGSSIVIMLSLGLGLLSRRVELEKSQKELESEKLNSELAFLKSQISPHFLFNTLNNIYSLIESNTADAQDAVIKLSKLMRYILDESEQEQISLAQEITFMNNYIDLMKIRLLKKVDLNLEFPGDHQELYIPPLLFIPFIENTFKHGVSYRGESFINVSLSVDEKELNFSCRNKLFSSKPGQDLSERGVGLDNARKRLNLLYPDRHELRIDEVDGNFQVNLKIRIEE
jgi:sensor histidine kinase YesM